MAEPIAVVGMSCRLPGGITSPSSFWDFLAEGKSGQGKAPNSRFNLDSFYHEDSTKSGTINGDGGYFLQDDTRLFDNSFFGINNLEAKHMDPQQRQLLEVVYECLESAGVSLQEVSGKNVGCYVANFTTDFVTIQAKNPEEYHTYSATGFGSTILANRISHVFNLLGPSVVLDTACSSSLYTLHTACAALNAGECDAAIVAGANLVQSPEIYIAMTKAGVLSGTSTCHTFDASADGYGRGEGVAALFLRRMDTSLEMGGPIRSVIRGTSINSNGHTPGITLPSAAAQEAVIKKAYAMAGLPLDETPYVECHGTGTPVGDPIEIEAISNSLYQKSGQPLLVGSVKTNIGHGEAVSGISSIIKATLALEKGLIPPTVGIKTLNPALKLKVRNIEVVIQLKSWPKNAFERISINSFGYGGANAHAILDSASMYAKSGKINAVNEQTLKDMLSNGTSNGTWNGVHSTSAGNVKFSDGRTSNGTLSNSKFPEDTPSNGKHSNENTERADMKTYIIPFSAHSIKSLEKNINNIEAVISVPKPLGFVKSLAYTLSSHRSSLSKRGFSLVTDSDTSVSMTPSRKNSSEESTSDLPFAFVFTGQGAQWPNMGFELMARFPIFRKTIQDLDSYLASFDSPPQWSIQEILSDHVDKTSIHKASHSQPICSAIQIAIVDLLKTWDIQPTAVIGHSSGEICAAYASGFITAEEAIAIAYYRGLAVSRSCDEGAMIAVGLGHEDVSTQIAALELSNTIRVACINSPESTTVSGEVESIEYLLQTLQDRGIFARKLKTDGKAYHSHLMSSAGQEYENLLAPIFWKRTLAKEKSQDTGANMFSTVTSQLEGKDTIGIAKYWRMNLESPVTFNSAMGKLLSKKYNIIEVGPHPVLGQPIRDIQESIGSESGYFSTLSRGKNSEKTILQLVGSLYFVGYSFSFSRINGFDNMDHKPKMIHDLPTYAWDHQDILWHESRTSTAYRNRSHKRHDILGSRIPGTPGDGVWWRNILKVQDVPWLQDHKLGQTIVFPAAAYVAMAIEGIFQSQDTVAASSKVILRDVNLLSLLVLRSDDGVELSMRLTRSRISGVNRSGTWWNFEISSFASGASNIHANGLIALEKLTTGGKIDSKYQCPKIGLDTHDRLGMRTWYNKLAKESLNFGSEFRSLIEVKTDRRKEIKYAKARTCFRQGGSLAVPRESSYLIHPVTIDSLLQAAIIASTAGKVEILQGKVPVLINSLEILCDQTTDSLEVCTIRAGSRKVGFGAVILGGELINSTGKIIAQMQEVRAITYTEASLQSTSKIVRDPALRILWKPDIFMSENRNAVLFAKYLKKFTSLLQQGLAPYQAKYMLVTGAVDLATHKNGRMRVLDLLSHDDDNSESSAGQRLIAERLKHVETYTQVTVKSTQEFLLETTDEENDQARRTLKEEPLYDLVIISEPKLASTVLNQNFNQLSGYLAPKAVFIFSSENSSPIILGDHFTVFSASHEGTESSVNFARRQESNERSIEDSKIILVHGEEATPLDLAIRDLLALIWQTKVVSLPFSEVSLTTISQTSIIITTIESGSTILDKMTESQLQAIKIIAERALVFLWITNGRLFKALKPEFSLIQGLSRSLMLERPSLKMPVLDLDLGLTDIETSSFHVASVLKEVLWSSKPDFEYRQYEGILYISRFVQDPTLNQRFRQAQDNEIVSLPIAKAGNCQLALKNVGQIETLRFNEIANVEVLEPRHLVVEVRSTGINAKDFYGLSDKIDIRESTCALEFSGVVRKTNSEFKVGDHVLIMAPSYFGTSEVVPEWACCKLKCEEDLITMSAIPLVFSTALYALENRAQLQTGESILIHSAAGGAGIAAIQIAQLIGAEIFATVGTSSKKEFLTSSFNIPSSHIFSSRDSTFLSKILKATSGKGVDVILNSLTGELLHESWKALAEFGRFIEIGKRDISDSGKLDMQGFRKGTTFTAFDLTDLFWSKKVVHNLTWQRLLYRSVELLREGKIKAVSPLKVFPASDISQAFRYFSQSSRIGKVAVSFEQELNIPVVPNKFLSSFDPNKTYILVGCLGGLGRSLSRWMLKQGARDFLYIGRSGLDKLAAKNLVEDLQSYGARVTVIRGDVANYGVVELAISAAMNPIGGIVQAAMSINVALVSEMPCSTWHQGITQKVNGAWNLHNALKGKDSQLDFFLMLSSITGSVGTATESNYCAANAFLDCFGSYRRSLGLPGISVGLGMISEVGFLHENIETEAVLLRKGVHPFTEEELLQIIDIALTLHEGNVVAGVDDGLGAEHYIQGHILTGLELHGFQKIRDAGFLRGTTVLEDPRCSFIAGAFANSEQVGTDESIVSNGASLPCAVAAVLAANESTSVPADALVDSIQAVAIDRIATLLLVDSQRLQGDTLLADFGMESMLAAEFRSDMFRAFKAEVSFAVLIDKRTTVRAVAKIIGTELLAKT